MKLLPDHISQRAVLAPLAGITDQPFRTIVKHYGAALMFTELVSAEGLVRESQKTFQLMHFSDLERPIGVQIFGNKPASMAEAAKIAEILEPDLIDLNFGCPAKKVVNGGSGAAVLNDLQLLKRIVGAVVKAVSTPVSCKIRSGWTEGAIIALEASRIIQGEGASLLTLHPRTKKQGFTGSADWLLIEAVKKAVDIPVIGNGDIVHAQDAVRMFKETGCDAVMVGRGVMGRPWILSRIDHMMQTGEMLPEPGPAEKIQTCLMHYDLAIKIHGIPRGLKEMRKQIGWYLKGLDGVSKIRSALVQMEDPGSVKQVLTAYAESFK